MKALAVGWRRALALVAVTIILLGVWAQPVAALELRRGTDVVIAANETINQDILIVANSVTIDGIVNGDAWVVASGVQVNGTVKGRLFWVGRNMQINGGVSGAFYGAGLTTTLSTQGNVGGDLMLLGSSLTTSPGSNIGQDVVMGGRQALLAGAVKRNVRFTGLALQVSGPVGNVTSTPTAMNALLRDVVMTVRAKPMEAMAAPQAQVTPSVGWGNWLLTGLRALITLLALGGLALWLIRRGFTASADYAQIRPLAAIGTGALVWLGGYVAAALSLIVVLAVWFILAQATLGSLAAIALGIGLLAWGFAFGVFLLLVSYGSKLVALYVVGRWIVTRLTGSAHEWRAWSLVVGSVAYILLRAIPYFGIAVSVIATAWGLGGIWLAYRAWRRRPVPPCETAWTEEERQREREREMGEPIPMS